MEQLVHTNQSKPKNTANNTGLPNEHMMNKTCQNFRTVKSNQNIRLMLLINTLLDQLTKIKLITPKISQGKIIKIQYQHKGM